MKLTHYISDQSQYGGKNLQREIEKVDEGTINAKKMGGTGRTNNVIRRAEQLLSIEEQMLSFAFKLGRADNQREARRAAR